MCEAGSLRACTRGLPVMPQKSVLRRYSSLGSSVAMLQDGEVAVAEPGMLGVVRGVVREEVRGGGCRVSGVREGGGPGLFRVP